MVTVEAIVRRKSDWCVIIIFVFFIAFWCFLSGFFAVVKHCFIQFIDSNEAT
ncbi:hypothetical protein DP344_24990 [Escherichia coli]|nr:hypothetical protein [Escherichia coli]